MKNIAHYALKSIKEKKEKTLFWVIKLLCSFKTCWKIKSSHNEKHIRDHDIDIGDRMKKRKINEKWMMAAITLESITAKIYNLLCE